MNLLLLPFACRDATRNLDAELPILTHFPIIPEDQNSSLHMEQKSIKRFLIICVLPRACFQKFCFHIFASYFFEYLYFSKSSLEKYEVVFRIKKIHLKINFTADILHSLFFIRNIYLFILIRTSLAYSSKFYEILRKINI